MLRIFPAGDADAMGRKKDRVLTCQRTGRPAQDSVRAANSRRLYWEIAITGLLLKRTVKQKLHQSIIPHTDTVMSSDGPSKADLIVEYQQV